MRKLLPVEVAAAQEAGRQPLPEVVAEALGELVGAAQEACSRSRSASDSACWSR